MDCKLLPLRRASINTLCKGFTLRDEAPAKE
jgi:hypothetical protein